MNLQALKNLVDNWETDGEKIVVKNELFNMVSLLKDRFQYDLLKSITAVDCKDDGIELIYDLFSTVNEDKVALSIKVQSEAESVSTLYDSAIADEKEIYDLFGIKFIGNKELTRLYMPEGWVGYPLKKDYEEKDERLNWNE